MASIDCPNTNRNVFTATRQIKSSVVVLLLTQKIITKMYLSETFKYSTQYFWKK